LLRASSLPLLLLTLFLLGAKSAALDENAALL
jgi:hypothetical protein